MENPETGFAEIFGTIESSSSSHCDKLFEKNMLIFCRTLSVHFTTFRIHDYTERRIDQNNENMSFVDIMDIVVLSS